MNARARLEETLIEEGLLQVEGVRGGGGLSRIAVVFAVSETRLILEILGSESLYLSRIILHSRGG